MKVLKGLKVPLETDGLYPVVTIGNFDGLHLGHMSVVNAALDRKKLLSEAICILITFDPHPYFILPDKEVPGQLLEFDAKVDLLEAAGVDYVVCLEYTSEFATISARDFVFDMLVDKIGTKELFVGSSFRFGKGGEGDIKTLEQIGNDVGFSVSPVLQYAFEGEIVSSSRIRKCMQSGEVDMVAQLLGRDYTIRGVVVKGHGRGETIGFPTANLTLPETMLPVDGIYAVRALIEGKSFNAVLYIGLQPTYGAAGERYIEVHIPGEQLDLYDKRLDVEFVKRIREDIAFKSEAELVSQISIDIEHAMEILTEPGL